MVFQSTDPASREGVRESPELAVALARELVRRAATAVDELDNDLLTAALVLAAGAAIGHKVDRIARVAKVPHALVARCARRLVDNGVWQAGRTVGSWTMDARAGIQPAEAFWSDARVACGRLCRRVGEAGTLEWAPSGQWWKSFELTPPQAEPEMAVSYRPRSVPEESQDVGRDREEEVAPGETVAAPVSETEAGADPESESETGAEGSVEEPLWLGAAPDGPVLSLARLERPPAALEEAPQTAAPDSLFPEAVWLG